MIPLRRNLFYFFLAQYSSTEALKLMKSTFLLFCMTNLDSLNLH